MENTQPDIITQILGGAARHVLTSGAGALVASGVIRGSDTETIVGAAMVLLGVAWSWWQKVGQDKTLKFLRTELSNLGGLVRGGHEQQAKALANTQHALGIAPSVPGGPLT